MGHRPQANGGGSDPPRRYGTCSPPRGEQEMISKREREPSSSFEGSEEDQRERRRTFDIELILWGTNSDHSGDRSPPESVTTREITKLEILVVAAERSSVLVLARALQSLAVRRLVCIPPTHPGVVVPSSCHAAGLTVDQALRSGSVLPPLLYFKRSSTCS